MPFPRYSPTLAFAANSRYGDRLTWNLLFLLISALAAAAWPWPARSETKLASPTLALVKPSEMKSGALLFNTDEEGRYVQAPLLGTDIDTAVSGPTARTRVSQHFSNPADGWVEGVYVFPLPENAAVDTMKMVIGDRVIVADIKERQTARQIYEDAKAAGKKTGLIEQERPNLFTTSVANIAPHDGIVIQIEYQETIRQSNGVFTLRAPLVVAPRYNPAPIAQTVDFAPGGNGWGSVTDPVPDRDRISPPVLDPRKNPPINPVTIKVKLQAGFPLGEVKSHHHGVKFREVADHTREIELDDGAVPADRDFELTWQPKPNALPSAGLFREHVGESDYLLGSIMPPTVDKQGVAEPREIVFVIDNSGSMGGPSMDQAKASLIYALGRLKPEDRFNVIRFDDTYDMLFSGAVPADAGNIGRAKQFVGGLQANGGTEILPAMQAALQDSPSAGSPALRQIVFLTDGAIGNEEQLFDAIGSRLGRSRIFMVGIGSAPNAYFMTRAAELGRGAYTFIGDTQSVDARTRELFTKLESPAVTNLVAKFSAGGVDLTPEKLPDLYRGEPLVFAARFASLGGAIEINGMIGSQPWTVTVPLANVAEGSGVSKLYAKRKIDDAEVASSLRKITYEEAGKRILALALEHHLVSRMTSLVAVDQTKSRPDGASLARTDLPLNLPAGWDFDKVFGGEQHAKARMQKADATPPAPDASAHDSVAPLIAPLPAPPAPQATSAFAPMKLASRAPGMARGIAVGGNASPTAVVLPKTATPGASLMLAGTILCLLGLMLAILARRGRWSSVR